MGAESGCATSMDRLLVVSSGLSTMFFTLIDKTILELSIRHNCRKKNAFSSCNTGYLGDIESDSQTVWTCTCMHYCAAVNAFNRHVLICIG